MPLVQGVHAKWNAELAESKMAERAYYEPRPDGVERLPTVLSMFHAAPPVMRAPHWHAQVEVNYIVRSTTRRMMSSMPAATCLWYISSVCACPRTFSPN